MSSPEVASPDFDVIGSLRADLPSCLLDLTSSHGTKLSFRITLA
ncbi:hypothetical protein [Antrihabitans stalagmiti]|nr:hypothetical protein [Antrihabitans stalagmiti]